MMTTGGICGMVAADRGPDVFQDGQQAAGGRGFARRGDAGAGGGLVGAVVGLAALAVGQHVVGLGDFLEAFLVFRAGFAGVRVVFAGQVAVGLFDVCEARAGTDAEQGVIVPACGGGHSHHRPGSA